MDFLKYDNGRNTSKLSDDNFYASPAKKQAKSRKRIIVLCLILCAICLVLDIYFIIGIF